MMSKGDAWLHPFVKGPLGVFAAYVPLPDLNGTKDWTEREGRIITIAVNGGFSANSSFERDLTALGVTQSSDFKRRGAGSLETGYAHAAAVIPITAPECILSKMAEGPTTTLKQALVSAGYAADGTLLGNAIHTPPVAGDSVLSNFDDFSLAYSLPNSMARNPLVKFGSYGMNKANASGVAAATVATSGFGYNSDIAFGATDYNVWNGELLLPGSSDATATGPSPLRGLSPVCAVIANDLPGLCSEFEDYSTMTSPAHWYHDKLSGQNLDVGGYQLGNFIPQFTVLDAGLTGSDIARARAVAPSTNLSQTAAQLALINPLRALGLTVLDGSGLPAETTPDPWFSRRAAVTGTVTAVSYRSLERARKDILANPWIGGDASEARLFEGKYEAADVQPTIESYREAMRQEGMNMVAGLSKEVFLTMQLAN